MGVGQVISDTFGIVRERFGGMLGLWAIYFGATIALSFVMVFAIGATGIASLAALGEGNVLAAGVTIVVLVVLFYLGCLLVVLAQYASLISMASPTGRPTFSDALTAGWRAAPALLLLMVVLIIGYIVFAVVFGLLGAAVATMGDAANLVITLLILPVLIWIGCRLFPLFAVMAVDRVRNPFTAITRSWRLTRGHALTIFLASLFFMVIAVVIFGVALLPSIGILRSVADPASFASPDAVAPALGGMALLFLGLLVASILYNLLNCAFMAVVHGTLTKAAGEGAAETFA